MTEAEFAAECVRLYSGHKREDDLTPQKLDALNARYRHLPLPVWHEAMDLALMDNQLPNANRLDSLVAIAEDHHRDREKQQAESDAKRAARHGGGFLGVVAEAARRSDTQVARDAIANIQRIIATAPPIPPFDHEAVGQTPWRKMGAGVRRA